MQIQCQPRACMCCLQGNMLDLACNSLSPGEPPLRQILAVMVVERIPLSRGGRENSTIIHVVDKLMRLNTTNEILGPWLSA